MNNRPKDRIFVQIIDTLDIPESAYQKAANRYKDLGSWFERPDAATSKFNPHIYSQGSFRLGTVTRPLIETEEYDLDLGCRLRSGITKLSHTQKQLKHLVKLDLEGYRKARNIESPVTEKHRCWRLQYKDELSFHLDAVPSIPEDPAGRQSLLEAIQREGQDSFLARKISNHAGAITDNRHPNYDKNANDWRISNSEGFAIWFETRMKLARLLMEGRAHAKQKAQVDELPAYEWKSPLQRCIQLLKRHRDVMFKDNPDSKPISVIITTLAGRAYAGEANIVDALENILAGMEGLIRPGTPRVPNPVNPSEDFADKWADLRYSHLNLAGNFKSWIYQAKLDFRAICQAQDTQTLIDKVKLAFSVTLTEDKALECLGITAPTIAASKVQKIVEPARPWLDL